MAEQEKKEGMGSKVKRMKGVLQDAIDRKAQEVANYGYKIGGELEAAGYPRLGAAAENTGAGVAALGSTVASEALETVPESPEEVLTRVGPGRIARGVRKVLPEGLRKRVEEFAKQKGVDPVAAVKQVEKEKGVTQDWVDGGAKAIKAEEAKRIFSIKRP